MLSNVANELIASRWCEEAQHVLEANHHQNQFPTTNSSLRLSEALWTWRLALEKFLKCSSGSSSSERFLEASNDALHGGKSMAAAVATSHEDVHEDVHEDTHQGGMNTRDEPGAGTSSVEMVTMFAYTSSLP